MTRRMLCATVLGAAACQRHPQAAARGLAFVANQESRSVAAVDLGAFAVLRQIRLDDAPTAVLSHPDRAAVYVLTPSNGTIHEIDPAPDKLTVRRRVRVSDSLHSIKFAPDGKAIWAMDQQGRKLLRLPLDGWRADITASLPYAPLDFDLGRYEQEFAGVSFGAQGSLGIFDWNNGKLLRMVPVSKEVGLVRFQSNGKQALVANLAEQALTVVRSSDGRIVTQLPLAVRPERMCMKRDGGEVYITGAGADVVVVVDPYHTQVSATLLAGRRPGEMAAAANPNYLLIANPESSNVSVFDIDSRRVVAVAAVGTEPSFIALTPDDQFALVLNRQSGDVAVLRLATLTPGKMKTVPLLTVVPVGSRPVSAAVRA